MTLAFKGRFVDLVIDESKLHTIREDKNDRWHVGRPIQFYKDNRLPTMSKFRHDGEALVVQVITIHDGERGLAPATVLDGKASSPRKIPGRRNTQPHLIIDGRQLTPLECQALSRRDGFNDFAELLDFFRETHGLPFTGKLIGWTYLRY